MTVTSLHAGIDREIRLPLPETLRPADLEDPAVLARCEAATAQDLLAWARSQWGTKVALVTSFQAEGTVLLDMAWRHDPNLRVITLDTGRLPQETYRLIERIRERYQIDIEIFFPSAQLVQEMVRQSGPDLFYQSVEKRLRCCHIRKVEPMRRALGGLDAWITGLRRDQNAQRAKVRKIELDPQDGERFKLSPLADWSSEEVWDYVKTYRLPHHPLYSRGYTSIGCAPCTRATAKGEDPRAGRWWWERGGVSECGLHGPPSSGEAGLVELGRGVSGG